MHIPHRWGKRGRDPQVQNHCCRLYCHLYKKRVGHRHRYTKIRIQAYKDDSVKVGPKQMVICKPRAQAWEEPVLLKTLSLTWSLRYHGKIHSHSRKHPASNTNLGKLMQQLIHNFYTHLWFAKPHLNQPFKCFFKSSVTQSLLHGKQVLHHRARGPGQFCYTSF